MTNWFRQLIGARKSHSAKPPFGSRQGKRSIKYVFLSYVSDDTHLVHGIREFLEQLGINVWMDKTSLLAGRRWKDQLRDAITDASFFLACFSTNYVDRESTYMDQELTIALEVLRSRASDSSWFIPVRLDNCRLPSGRGLDLERLMAELQWIDCFSDFSNGLAKLGEVLLPELRPEQVARATFESAVELHITRKIEHFQSMAAPLRPEIVARWRSCAGEGRLTLLSESFSECHRRAVSTMEPQLEMFTEPERDGLVALLSVVPHRDIGRFLRSLPSGSPRLGHRYLDFIADRRAYFRLLDGWEDKDFMHIIQFEDQADDEVTVDMLFMESLRLRSIYVGRILASQREAHAGQVVALPEAHMYPTMLVTALEAGKLWDFIYRDDLQSRREREAN